MPRKPTVVVEAEAEVRRATSIKPEAIQEEYVAVPSDVYRWARVVAGAQQAVDEAKAELEHWEHSEKVRLVDVAEAEARGNGKVGDIKPPGEDRLKSEVRGSAGYLQRRRAIIAAERVKDDAMAVLEAVRKKADMLTNLGVTQRLELEMAIRDGQGIRDRSGRRA